MGMIVEQPADKGQARDGLEAVHAVLRAALEADDARQRRAAVLAADPRDEAEVSALFVDLDGLIEALRRRAKTADPPPVPSSPRPPRRQAPSLETHAPGETEVDIDDLDALVPPVPDGDTEPPPLPAPGALEPRPDKATQLAVIPAVEADTAAVNLLYDDIVWLVSIDDWAGALISLERLLVMAKVDGQIKEFVDVNEVKLLNVYESYLGPFSKIPKVLPRDIDNAMPSAYERAEKIRTILELIDDQRTLSDLMRDAPLSPLETCCVINQLRRSGVLEV